MSNGLSASGHEKVPVTDAAVSLSRRYCSSTEPVVSPKACCCPTIAIRLSILSAAFKYACMRPKEVTAPDMYERLTRNFPRGGLSRANSDKDVNALAMVSPLWLCAAIRAKTLNVRKGASEGPHKAGELVSINHGPRGLIHQLTRNHYHGQIDAKSLGDVELSASEPFDHGKGTFIQTRNSERPDVAYDL